MGKCYIGGSDKEYRGVSGNTRVRSEKNHSKYMDNWRSKIKEETESKSENIVPILNGRLSKNNGEIICGECEHFNEQIGSYCLLYDNLTCPKLKKE
jgi:hypothetical protein